ncbi:MAG: DivIVA domain-containing protein [Bacteroidetes bacterium]|nr:DivIVA domain-containing protein [Bacteroidota bacterium]
MKITSLDIRKQEFNRSFRGYDMDEVDSFLQVLATQWQELVDDLRRSGEKVSEQQLKLDHYMKVEEALEQALQTARSSARITIENAEMKARNTLEDAENRVVDLQKNADSERLQMKRDTAKYAVRQQEIVAKLRAFLTSEMEILSHFDSENIRPSLVGSSAMKQIELVRDEPLSPHADDEHEPEIEPEAPSEPKSAWKEVELNVFPTGGREGSRSSWEELEEESSGPQSSSSSTPLDGPENDWNTLEAEDDLDDLELDDESEVGTDEIDLEPETAPSWRVTPIFNSDDNSDDTSEENSDDASNDEVEDKRTAAHREPLQGYKNLRFPGSNLMSEEVGVDDETEAEIRKIHQILKDLDDE